MIELDLSGSWRRDSINFMQNLLGETEFSSVVYMLQYSNEPIYKIGYSSHFNRRLCDINALLPYPAESIHVVFTDSPRWLEKYWHKRFAPQRRQGSGILRPSEWFDLSEKDVAEFKSQPELKPSPNPQLQIDFDAANAQTRVELRQQEAREAIILRVIDYYDALAEKNPNSAVKLANSCNFQISRFDEKITQMQSKHFSKEAAIARWARDAHLAADAKIRS